MRSRLALVVLLLAGLAFELVLPNAIEPEHYLEHGAQARAVEHAGIQHSVVLHHEDGDHHHDTPQLELAEQSRLAHCGLCAWIGKTDALVGPRIALSAQLDRAPSFASPVHIPSASRRYGLRQPRAPPLV